MVKDMQLWQLAADIKTEEQMQQMLKDERIAKAYSRWAQWVEDA
jgi:hypothetical protein